MSTVPPFHEISPTWLETCEEIFTTAITQNKMTVLLWIYVRDTKRGMHSTYNEPILDASTIGGIQNGGLKLDEGIP
jgi:hypothetical protein